MVKLLNLFIGLNLSDTKRNLWFMYKRVLTKKYKSNKKKQAKIFSEIIYLNIK